MYKIISLLLSILILSSAPAQAKTRIGEPSNRNFSSDDNSHRNTEYDYELRANRVYIGFYSFKNFKGEDEGKSLRKEFGTLVAHYLCNGEWYSLKQSTESYEGFKFRDKAKGVDCELKLQRIDAYNAKHFKKVIINFKGNQLAQHQIRKDGLFYRIIFNRSEIQAKPALAKLYRQGTNYYQEYVRYHYENVPAEAPYYANIRSEHRVSIIDKGVAALKLRLDMIKRAKKSIDFLTYLYDPDQAGRLFTQALAAKAREGVKVRVLIDRAPFGFHMKKKFTTAMQKAGIEVKLHNNNFFKLNPWQVRNHQKVLIIDNREFVTGGRNIGDAYFGLNKKSNFVDRDIWIYGPVTSRATRAFEAFWNHDISEVPKMKEKYARDFLIPNAQDIKVLAQVHSVGAEQFETIPVVTTKSATFMSDRPGSNDDYTRIVGNSLFHYLRENQNQEVVIESPYFLVLREGKDILHDMLNKGIPTSLLTNSRYSIGTSHVPIAYVLEKMNKKHVQKGMDVYGYSGHKMPDEEILVELNEKAPTELHGKSMVIGNNVFIGTYNLDPRSKYFNVEMGVYFENEPRLASLMSWSYMRMVYNSLKMNEDGDYEESQLLELIQRKRSEIVDNNQWASIQAVFIELFGKDLI